MGLDKHKFSETSWDVGKIGDDVAIQFLSEPDFPIWIGGFASAFQSEEKFFENP